jgi:amidohydrolase
MGDSIQHAVSAYICDAIDVRRQIHAHPELSYDETATQALLVREFKSLGLEVQTDIGGIPSVLATLHGGKGEGKTIAIRADMDALQIQEETGLPFASETPGVMHACGHDGHMAILVGTAKVLTALQNEFAGTVVFLGQPGEEHSPNGGAKAIVKSGVLDGIDGIYALHVWPTIRTGKIGILPGPMMAASDRVTVTIRGRSSHAAMPQRGVDAIVAAGQFITAVQTLISRRINPLYPAVLTFGKINGGTRYNIVSDEVVIEGTCRTYDKEAQNSIEANLCHILDGLDAMFDTKSSLAYQRGYSAVRNTPEQAAFMKKIVMERFGKEALADVTEPAMTAEDFSGLLDAYGGGFFWLGATPEGEPVYPLHNSHFAVDEKAIAMGMEMMASTVLEALATSQQDGKHKFSGTPA